MKKILIMACLFATFLNAHAAEEKWTFEKANESAKKNSPTYQREQSGNAITTEMGNYAWKEYNKKPTENPGEGNGSNLEEVWTGSAASVPITWGQGDYYVEMTFNKNNTAGSVWLTVDNTNLKKSVAVPSPYNYEANWHITYANGIFKAEGKGHGSTTPSITRISKFPTPQLNDCTAGQTESQTLYCTGSGQMTCEPGKKSRTCASNGGWTPWQTVRQPSCITGTQQCR